MRQAQESLKVEPLSEADAEIRTFVKAEKINLTTKDDPAPRVIQPRSARFNAVLGSYIKHLEPILFKHVRKVFGEHTIYKGLNALQRGRRLRGQWDRFRKPVAVGLDASRFDQHVRKEMLVYEHAFYTRFYPRDKTLRWLLFQQLANRCVAYTRDGIIRYVTDGGRMSGDMNTALGNCLIMCALLWTYLREKQLLGKVAVADDGDDSVVIMEEEDLEHFCSGLKLWFWRFGFDIKVETPVREFEQIDFCQCSPIWTPEGWMMVRNPHNALDKDLVSFDNIANEKQWRIACGLIGECGLHLAGHIPIFSALYRKYFEIGGSAKRPEAPMTGMWFLSRGLDNSLKPIHPETRVSFWAAFGITPEVQRALEQRITETRFTYQSGRKGNIEHIFDINLFRDRRP